MDSRKTNKENKKRGRPSGKSSKDTKTSKSCTSGAATANKELRKDYDLLANKKQGETDACDCFIAQCPGCWYPCETCGSTKCSTFCRTIGREEQLEWRIFN